MVLRTVANTVSVGYNACRGKIMTKREKLIAKILQGSSDTNITFDDLCELMRSFDFEERIRGSHHVFTRDDIEEIINIQPRGSLAKPYQVKQVRGIIISYKLGGSDV